MSTTPRQPRKRPSPSTRDQAIYLAYQTSGKTQAQLAEDHNLTQTRISQIVRRVAGWRSKADPRDAGEPTTRQQKRLDRYLEHHRLEEIIRLSLQSFHHEQRTFTTTVHSQSASSAAPDSRPPTPETRTTTRELPANVQYLKTALRAIEQLSRFEDKPYLPVEEPDERQRENIMYYELCRIRKEAEQTGKVSESTDAWGPVKRWLDALQGEPNDSKRPDPAMHELAKLILPVEQASPLAPPAEPLAYVDGDQQHQRETCNLEPETSFSSHSPNPLTTTCAPAPSSSQPPLAQDLTPSYTQPEKLPDPSTTPNLKPETSNLKPTSPPRPLSKSPPPPLSPAARRIRHDAQLEQLRHATLHGLPCLLEFDPADGPLPFPSHHLDDPGCSPSPPSKSEESQLVRDYLEKLRAEHLANAS